MPTGDSSRDARLRPGWAALIYEIASTPTLVAPSSPLPEDSAHQLSVTCTLDDSSRLTLPAAWFTWQLTPPPGGDSAPPLHPALSPQGLLTTGQVWQAAPLSLAVSGPLATLTAAFTIADTIPDNFGLYAGDATDDAWQVTAFGLENPRGRGDTDYSGSGQTNAFKWLAGLDPLDPAARFTLLVTPIPAGGRQLRLSPCLPDRDYRIWTSTDLLTWTPLPAPLSPAASDGSRTATDPSPAPLRFYRASITLPDQR